jgi:DNA-binding NarL/FixJ family response regulator
MDQNTRYLVGAQQYECLEEVMSKGGNTYGDRRTQDGVLIGWDHWDRLPSNRGTKHSGLVMTDGLSKRECDVLSCLQQGLSNKEIGLLLSISPRTVQKHLQRVYQHLGVESRVEAIVVMRRAPAGNEGV